MSSVVRSSRLRSAVGAIVLSMAVACGGLLPATAVASPAPVDAPAVIPDSAADEATAAEFAKKGHKTVQVDDKTTEIAETVANPDGTLTQTQHLRPVRVKQNGAWVQPDSTLTPKAGALAPKAGTTDIGLSTGRGTARKSAGVQPLVRLDRDGTTAGFDWPGALPTPVVDGARAIYPEVMPGVDLQVDVDVDTVREVVVVKTAEAAKRVAKLDLTIPLGNGTVTKDADGSLHVRDAKGTEKFFASPAKMWDSSGVDADGRNFARGPAPGGHQAAVGQDLTGTKLTLTPDQKLLTAADTVYPVYVDPTWHDVYCGSCGRNHYLVQYACGSGKTPGFAEWDTDDNLRAGYVNDSQANCNGSHLVTARSFVEMNLGGLSGKKIYGSKLTLGLTNRGDCADRDLNKLVWAGGISPGLTFNSGPWWVDLATIRGCPTNVGFDVTATVASVAKDSPTWTFGLVSTDEGDFAAWKKYSPQVGFSVTYNSPPRQPTNLQIYNGTQGYPCVQGANRPVLGRTSTGYVVKANVSDPDNQDLGAYFRVYKGLVSRGPGNYVWDKKDFLDDNIGSDANTANRNAVYTLPLAEMNADGFYSWDTHSTDGKDEAWAVPCEVEVELSAPAAPVVASQTYPAGEYGGGPGRPGDFAFTVSNSPTTVDHYVWKLDNTAAPSCNGTEPGTVKPKAFNGPGTAAIAPGASGPHILSAWSCNRAKTPSTRVDYSFTVKDAAAPVASWQFEGDGKSQVSGLRYAGAGTGNFAAGKLGQSVTLSGQAGDYFATSTRVLDVAKSFTVSAWVNAADLSTRSGVLSQDGDQSSGFALQYLETGKWAFSLSSADVANPTLTSAVSTAGATAGSWTHLTGVYDAAAHTATLYVNGQAQQTVTATAAGGTGPLVLGGAKSGAVRSYLLKGSIDEVAAFGRALSAADVTKLYAQNGVPATLAAVREYTLDGDPKDATGTDGTLILSGTNGYGEGYSDSAGQSATEDGIGHGRGQALVYSSTLYGRMDGPVVDPRQGFTVSAWVKPADANYYSIVEQEGAHESTFRLSMSPEHWGIGLSTTDIRPDLSFRWAGSPAAPRIGVWTHLAGVYNPATGKEVLYVDGVQAAETVIAAGTVWRGDGPFTVGAIFEEGALRNGFNGSIDQLQVWDRALPTAEVAELANTPVLRASYQLDGTATDSVSGATGTLSGGASLTTDDGGAQVARFDKSWTGQIEGPRPENFRGDHSFTVEAWVRHTWTEEDAAASASWNGVDPHGRKAVSLNSPRFSPFMLGWQPTQDADGKWRPRWGWVLGSSTAAPGHPFAYFDTTTSEAESNVWTHLTGTYDATSRTACLYAATDQYQYSPACLSNVDGWNGDSPLEDLLIGRGVYDSQLSDYWYGDLRGIRVYSGVLDAQHINADAIVDHP